MGCCNEPVTALATATPDASQHVNFAKGMVLGVDDFQQEYAYHAGHLQWLARDAIGYGTLSGLRVLAVDAGADGPQLQVTRGSALVPSGKLVCVGADQCAVINRWLAKPENAVTVEGLLNPGSPLSSPPSSPPLVDAGRITLYLTLCYTECLTRPVPIPGEPCRSEDELMEKSRVAEDFHLALRDAPPLQVEDDALRDFVRWLRINVQVIDSGPPTVADEAMWLEVLRPAAQPWFDAVTASPPLSPPVSVETLGDYLFDVSPPYLVIAPSQLCAFLRVAFRFWVTELRPMWMAMRCHLPLHRDLDCVLLAQVAFDVQWIGGSPGGAWQIVGGPATVTIDESRRPFVTHLRLLQEWALCGCDCAGPGTAGGISSPPSALPFLNMEFGPFRSPAPRGAASPMSVPLLATNAGLALDDTHYCIICRGASTLKLALPASTPSTAGRVYIVKNVNVTTLTLSADAPAGDTIEAAPTTRVKKGGALTVLADGDGHWHVIGTA